MHESNISKEEAEKLAVDGWWKEQVTIPEVDIKVTKTVDSARCWEVHLSLYDKFTGKLVKEDVAIYKVDKETGEVTRIK